MTTAEREIAIAQRVVELSGCLEALRALGETMLDTVALEEQRLADLDALPEGGFTFAVSPFGKMGANNGQK